MKKLFRCPKCKSNLNSFKVKDFQCQSCGAEFAVINNFISFIDKKYLPVNYETTQSDIEFLTQEGQTTRDRFNRYFIPLFQKLGLKKDCAILCLGCGSGDDVETFIAARFKNTFGIDMGWRSDWWQKNSRDPEHFFIADGRKLPFSDGSFDVVISLGVIEHVGAIGDSAELYPDVKEQRLDFIREACRLLKNDGRFILACPNRLFPIDFQHNISQSQYFKLLGDKFGMSFHSPFNPMLLSYSDIAGYCNDIGKNYSVIPLPQTNYLGLKFRNSPFLKPFSWICRLIFRLLDMMPKKVRESFLNPYMLCEIKKNHL